MTAPRVIPSAAERKGSPRDDAPRGTREAPLADGSRAVFAARDDTPPATALIVCGYDLDTDLAAYVADVVRAIADEPSDVVILTGGRTSPLSNDSEAGVMSKTFARLAPERAVLLDEEATSSLENLLHGKRMAEERHGAIGRYVVVGDTAHRRKLAILARLVLGKTASVLAVPRPTPLITHLLEPISIFFESIGAVVPATRRYVRSGALLFKQLRYGTFFTSVSQ